MTETNPNTILAERFAKAFDAFVAEVRAAVTEGILNPAVSSTPAFLAWQVQALPQLDKENAEIQNGYARFLIGEVETLPKLARYQLALAKHLDGFQLDFAGSDRAKTLDELETAVVVIAYQFSTAAGTHIIPPNKQVPKQGA